MHFQDENAHERASGLQHPFKSRSIMLIERIVHADMKEVP